jgi:lipopolysaccharide/colanic/teichoic acid biosynthesis glycosyltransferase
MYTGSDRFGSVTTGVDKRVTPIGRILRKYKLDELPQLWNVFTGTMSFVGPRPDVSGYADKLTGEDRIILSVRPGITGPASLRFRNEEELLAKVDNPQQYNDEVIWPRKVTINREYVEHYSFIKDILYIFATVFGRGSH